MYYYTIDFYKGDLKGTMTLQADSLADGYKLAIQAVPKGYTLDTLTLRRTTYKWFVTSSKS